MVDCCTGVAVTDGAQETVGPSNADGGQIRPVSCASCPADRCLSVREAFGYTCRVQDVAVSERNQDADMDHGTMQVCAASQGRQKWVTARAVYPKARLPDRSGTNAR